MLSSDAKKNLNICFASSAIDVKKKEHRDEEKSIDEIKHIYIHIPMLCFASLVDDWLDSSLLVNDATDDDDDRWTKENLFLVIDILIDFFLSLPFLLEIYIFDQKW